MPHKNNVEPLRHTVNAQHSAVKEHKIIVVKDYDEIDFEPKRVEDKGKEVRTNLNPRILLWCYYDPLNAATMGDHVNALMKYSKNDVLVVSKIGNLPDDLDLDLFDAIIIHYSLGLAHETYVSEKAIHRLSQFKGVKGLFIQDEYRFINRTKDTIRRAGISLVFTCVSDEEIPHVYPPEELPDVHFVNVLTGYVPYFLTIYPTVPLSERKIDIGYRGRDYPAWHGRAGREKIEIGKRVEKDARKFGLKVDIKWREEDRLYGRAWREFIQNSRAVLSVESGCSIFDFDGTLGPKVETYEQLLGKKTSYEKVKARFFEGLEDKIDLSQLSPRVFEAVALRTLLIMYEGQYSGVLKPWRHYLPLKKDHSNMDEIVRILKDDVACGEIIANAYGEIAMSDVYSFRTFVRYFDEILQPHLKNMSEKETDMRELWKEFGSFIIDNPHELTKTTSVSITKKYKSLQRFKRIMRYILKR
jgi:hypothetical protein